MDPYAPTPPQWCPECGARVIERIGGSWCPRCQGHLQKIETRSYDQSPPTPVLSWRVVRR